MVGFDALTFPRITTTLALAGPHHYLVVPAERVEELHGSGGAFSWQRMAAFSLWRSVTAPTDEVLAEVEAFNADPRRGWANLIRQAAIARLERANAEVQVAKDRATAALLMFEGAEDLIDEDDENDENDEVHP